MKIFSIILHFNDLLRVETNLSASFDLSLSKNEDASNVNCKKTYL